MFREKYSVSVLSNQSGSLSAVLWGTGNKTFVRIRKKLNKRPMIFYTQFFQTPNYIYYCFVTLYSLEYKCKVKSHGKNRNKKIENHI